MDERTKRRVATSTRFGDIRELAEIDSTNRVLMDLAREGAPEGVVVIANHQTAGRGRLGRTWNAPPGGGLLASILLRPDVATLPPARWWLAGAAVALAAAEACEGVGARPQIKWPNDLLLDEAKLAGILAEVDPTAPGAPGAPAPAAIVVGIGVNVGWAPPGAASLGASVDRGNLLADLLERLEAWCCDWPAVGDAYRARCASVGRLVRVEIPGPTIVGRAEAVEPDGRLRVLAGGQIHLFSAADAVHLRPDGPAQNITGP